MDVTALLISGGLVLLFILIGGVFAATEIALISLRESQLHQLAERGARGARVARIARNPNRFLSAVQIGVTVAGFFSAAYGAAAISPALEPLLIRWGLPPAVASTATLIVLTLLIAYLSLVLGELVPKRLALQRSSGISMVTGPILDAFATVMRPVIWLLSVSTNAVVRLLGADPKLTSEQMTTEELRHMVIAHEAMPEHERQLLTDVFDASDRTVGEVMRPRHEVAFLRGQDTIEEAVRAVAAHPYSRYPVIGADFDDVLGFVSTRDLLLAQAGIAAQDNTAQYSDGRRRSQVSTENAHLVRDLVRPIQVLPATNDLLPSISILRHSRIHIAIVLDEYGGTDGIVTLKDLVEELVGEIYNEHDTTDEDAVITDDAGVIVDAGLNLEDFEERVGCALEDEGDYETVGGYVTDRLGRVAQVGDEVATEQYVLEVTEVVGHRIERVRVRRLEGRDDAAS